ncbi:hypothetical protein DL93DRAFT_2078190 [Clavulina sp. PMI_390]|nr:hypothetical protein DL93DRAFT_2078190 [Clavulina sp. PMI_390]
MSAKRSISHPALTGDTWLNRLTYDVTEHILLWLDPWSLLQLSSVSTTTSFDL